MLDSRWLYYCLLIFIISLTCSVFIHGNVIDRKILHVGDELLKETLPLQMGSCLYKLEGLKSNTWYEVKISYPASIPSRFSLQLKKDSSDVGLHTGRKLLNTEKLIFKTDGIDSLSDQQGLQVLVTVEPEGVVSIPGTQERNCFIGPFSLACGWIIVLLFYIPYIQHFTQLVNFIAFGHSRFSFQVCDELILGIPHKAWYVVFLVLLCLGLAAVVPKFLPPFFLPKNGSPSLTDRMTAKDS